MMGLREADETALRWTRARPTLFALRDGASGGRVAATLRWAGERAVVRTAEGGWTLTHRGLVVQRVAVAAETAQAPERGVASFSVTRDLRHRWRLPLAERTPVRWQLAGPASADWVCIGEAGGQLMALRPEIRGDQRGRGEQGEDTFNVRGRVSLADGVREWPEAAFVLSLGWYLLLVGRALAPIRAPVMSAG